MPAENSHVVPYAFVVRNLAEIYWSQQNIKCGVALLLLPGQKLKEGKTKFYGLLVFL